MPNTLYYGDCLTVLRDHIPVNSVDLIYLDPPFNSQRNYNVLFKTPEGHKSDAQVEAFMDTWTWGDQAEREFEELLKQPNTDVAEMIRSMRGFLGEIDLMAYLVIMTNRLLEIYRVLKPTGSMYLHCDPTASHYLKVSLDTVFGLRSYRDEIVWQRTNVHNDSKSWSHTSDTIFFYTKGKEFTWNPPYERHDQDYVDDKYRYSDPDGRKYTLDNMTSPNPRPNMIYEWKGHASPPNGWRYSKETMAKLDSEGRIWYPDDKSKRPRLKRYLDEMPGRLLSNVWTDIPPINSQAKERLGYPTQKPLALLERIINTSSNPGDVVLDPFCGCGTAVHAAQKLGRQWIGIDITSLAIDQIERRMLDAFPGISFTVHGVPKDIDGARDLARRDKYEFQYWACTLVDAQPYQNKKKGADSGIDGIRYFADEGKGTTKKAIVSVKGGDNVGRAMIADLKNTVDREKAQIGLFVTLAKPTKEMLKEATVAGFYESPIGGQIPKIQILTVEGLLNGTESAKVPDLSRGLASFKAAPTETDQDKQLGLFGGKD